MILFIDVARQAHSWSFFAFVRSFIRSLSRAKRAFSMYSTYRKDHVQPCVGFPPEMKFADLRRGFLRHACW